MKREIVARRPAGWEASIFAPVVFLLLRGHLASQEMPPIPLTIKDVTTNPAVSAGPVWGRTRCDVAGNVYVRILQAEDPLTAPVVKIPRDGKTVTRFDVRSVRGFEKNVAYDFAVSLRGEVYLVTAEEGGEPVVVVFRENGTYDRTISLDGFREASRIQVFSSGELLILGTLDEEGKKGLSERPLTAVVDASGRFLRSVRLPDEPAGGEKALLTGEQRDQLLDLQRAVPGDDGNIYVYRPRTLFQVGSPTPIWVLSSAGELVRTINAKPPNETFKVFAIRQGGGRIAVQFIETNQGGLLLQHIISILDAETGEKLVDYAVPIEAGGLLACYTPNGFSFLGRGKQGEFTLEFAPLK